MIYIFTVLWFTVFKRSMGSYGVQLELFWSVKEWLAGDTGLGKEILANIAMFIPFGFLCSFCLKTSSNIHRVQISIILGAALLALSIEILQIALKRGLFEWDDVFFNTLGAIIGCLIYRLLEALTTKIWFSRIVTAACVLTIAGCFTVYTIG